MAASEGGHDVVGGKRAGNSHMSIARTPARFITFEGGEGSGKSTQSALLCERLKADGIDVVATREPGGSPFAEQVREFILGGETAPHPPIAEALLFYAARADHLARTIRPALAAGRWVVCDRFSDSTRVYQGTAGGVALQDIDALEAIIVAPTRPDLTFILDVPAAVGLARTRTRAAAADARTDPYEARDLAYHEHLREGFLAIARAEPERCVVLDGRLEISAAAERIWRVIEERFGGQAR